MIHVGHAWGELWEEGEQDGLALAAYDSNDVGLRSRASFLSAGS